jgi:bacteriophage N4 adsorption protein B
MPFLAANEWVDAVAVGLVILKVIMAATALVFFLSGIDDLFIDICFLLRSLYILLVGRGRDRPLSESELRGRPEQPIAVMLPAWDESAVIRAMLMNAAKSIDYRNFHIFVGVYPNDAATRSEVELARQAFDNIHCIVTGSPGPTNKADCLNWIFHGIRQYEKDQGMEFQIFVMQDCEDVIHPLCYKVFNAAIPNNDMVQLPVHSLPRKWWELTGGHYLDEFSQLHTKDLIVRELLNRSIPGAGVGLGFSRNALLTVAAHNGNEVFSVDSLTEDYDFGFRMKEYGLRQAFIRYWVTRPRPPGRGLLAGLRPRQMQELVCIKEFFPGRFHASVRQKSRWVVGIVFQGWEHLGWRGGIGTRYMLYRDRKALVTNFVNLIGYLVVAVVLAELAFRTVVPDAYRYPPLVEHGGLLWYLIIANALLLLERVAMRAWCVLQVHDLPQAVLSVPRTIWGNVINFFATVRAVRLYWRYVTTGKLIAWDKTAHVYPSEEELSVFQQRIEYRLLERNLISAEQLEAALAEQQKSHRPIEQILLEMRCLTPADLEAALATAR